jgi:hypothetical protein
MTVLWIILGALGGVTLGFVAGLRYGYTKLLPTIIARLDPRELSKVVKEAARIRDSN